MTALDRLAALLRQEGGLLAVAVTADATDEARTLGDGAATGTDAETASDYAFLLEAIREGYLQHYGEGRVLRIPDPDLALLAGDRLYALGLSRLADLGDLDAVKALADLISDCARAHAEGRPDKAENAWRSAVDAMLGSAGPRSGACPESTDTTAGRTTEPVPATSAHGSSR